MILSRSGTFANDRGEFFERILGLFFSNFDLCETIVHIYGAAHRTDRFSGGAFCFFNK